MIESWLISLPTAAMLVACLAVPSSCLAASYEYLSDHPGRVVLFQSRSDAVLGKALELGLDRTAYWVNWTNWDLPSGPRNKGVSEVPAVPLKIGEAVYEKGIGYAGTSMIYVQLDGDFSRFEAEVGPANGEGRFWIYVDGKRVYESGKVVAAEGARKVSVDVVGGQQMRLLADTPDYVWANARLLMSPNASEDGAAMDVARFGRVITNDPERMEGARASLTEAFRAEDICLDTEIFRRGDGTYVVPILKGKKACVGLSWMERRKLREMSVKFADPASAPSIDVIEVQRWAYAGPYPGGDTKWTGNWVPAKGRLEASGDTLTFHFDGEQPRTGYMKVRWIFPAKSETVVLQDIQAKTYSPSSTAKLVLRVENPVAGKQATLEMYNGEIMDGRRVRLRKKWDISRPLELSIRCCKPRFGVDDRTLVRVELPGGAFSVKVSDVLGRGCVYVKDFGLFVTPAGSTLTLAKYKKKIAGERSIPDRVREMPDQTFEAASRSWNVAPGSPMVVSLACDNRKFAVARDGAVSFNDNPDNPDFTGSYLTYRYNLVPTYGSGASRIVERRLEGGWRPIPVTTIEDSGVRYRVRSFVVPYDKSPQPVQGQPWLNRKPLYVAEYTMENAGEKPASGSITLQMKLTGGEYGDAWRVESGEKNVLAEIKAPPGCVIRAMSGGVAMVEGGRLLAFIDTREVGGLKQELKEAALSITGEVPSKERARLFVYIPGWEMSPEQYQELKGGADLLGDVYAYWDRVMHESMQIDLPDKALENAIIASQVHCLIAARNSKDGSLISPWIGSMLYGGLNLEGHGVILGMQFMGQEEFCKRAFAWYSAGYRPEGYLLKNFHTLAGTGFHLSTVGFQSLLSGDKVWLKSVEGPMVRMADWVDRQRTLMKQKDTRGEKIPEYGLFPPGACGDVTAYNTWFGTTASYFEGLNTFAQALLAISDGESHRLATAAIEFKRDIGIAFAQAKAISPVIALRDGTWVPFSPSTPECPGIPTEFRHYYAAEYGYMAAIHGQVGASYLASVGALDPDDKAVDWITKGSEDNWFLDGQNDNHFPMRQDHDKDWFNLGVASYQAAYARYPQVYAKRDDVKPFLRSFLNTLAALLNPETLCTNECIPPEYAAWGKTSEAGWLLRDARSMLVDERGDELWLAPFVSNRWLRDGMNIRVANAPTYFGRVGYRISSHTAAGYIEAVIDPPARKSPKSIIIRLRHPDGKRIRSVTLNGTRHSDFDVDKECIRIRSARDTVTVRAYY